MSGRTNEEIKKDIDQMRHIIVEYFGFNEPYEFVDNFDISAIEQISIKRSLKEANIPNLVYLGNAINRMSTCDLVIFGHGYTRARGCRIEKKVADEYGIQNISLNNIEQHIREGFCFEFTDANRLFIRRID